MTAPISRPLTKTQLNYATARLDMALKERLAKAIAHLKEPECPKPLTAEEKYKLIASGKAKLKPFDECNHSYLLSAYGYPDQEKKMAVHTAALIKYKEECAKCQKPVHLAHRHAMDTLIMGNAETALAIVEAFAAGK